MRRHTFMVEHDKPGIIRLLSRFFGRHELRKQRAVWMAFGVNYEAEKAKQEAIWRQFQRRRGEKGRGEGDKGVGRVRLRAKIHRRRLEGFLEALTGIVGIDTQAKREEAIRRLEELAQMAHKYAVDESLSPSQRLRWARIEAYIYQVVNTVLREYDSAEIKRRIEELRSLIENELGKRAGAPREADSEA